MTDILPESQTLPDKKFEAARILQRAIRRKIAYDNRAIKVTTVGKGIVNIRLSMKQPSMIFGEEALALDLNKLHEVMVTRVNISEVSLVLTSNQGTPEAFTKHLKDYTATYGAVINGGFFAINGFYGLETDQPIGLHRFTYNASSGGSRKLKKDTIKKDFDNTIHYFGHSIESVTKPFEDYENKKEIDSQLHLKTQTPQSVKDHYGLFRITLDGQAELEKLKHFDNDAIFKNYLENARYLLSSGPILVWDGKLTFTQDMLSDPRYQFKTVYDRFGTHPGSVPPGTFYHADQLNPRSAIGFTVKGELLMVTVKGEEDPSKRDGMTLPQFALLMKLLGAEKAVNLDGGYSAFQGVYDGSKMLTPIFSKKSGREKLTPCSIVAKEKTDVSKSYVNPPKEINFKNSNAQNFARVLNFF
jgi:hypothetical protein